MRFTHPLVRLIGARLLQGIVVVAGALLVCFVLGALSGDPADLLSAAQIGAGTKQIQALREHLGYGDPFFVRLGHFVTQVAHANFGQSYRTGQGALGLVLKALPNTLLLVGCALVLALSGAVALAVLSVLHRGRLLDRVIRRVLAVVQGVPEFWLATMLVLVFTVSLGALPSIGFEGPESLILPAVSLAIPLLPTFVRLARGSLLDVMKLDFVTSLRGRGLSEREIVLRHALRNAMPSLVTFTALQVGWLIGGTIIVESIFSFPGIGNLAVEAVRTRDLTIVQAVVAVVAVSYVVLNLLADVLTAVLDPRIRIGGA